MFDAVRSRLSLPRALSALVARWTAQPEPTLQPYQHKPVPLRHSVTKFFVTALIAFVGMMYGFMIVIFPPAFYLYMAMPILIMMFLIIWILPETDNIPEKKMRWLFFAYFVSFIAWPNYIAYDPPGLPWITLSRLWSAPLTLMFLISISVSPSLRASLKTVWNENPWIFRLLVAFEVILIFTMPFSKHIAATWNLFLSAQMEFISIFFIGVWVFSVEGSARKFAKLLCIVTVVLCFLSIWEYRIEKVPWVDHIPQFLMVQDESVQRMLASKSRGTTGQYRLQSVFPGPLNAAEFFALSTPFFIYFLIETKRVLIRVAILAFIPFLFTVIMWTDSRLGIVGFIVSCASYLLMWGIRRWLATRHDLVSPAVVLAYPALMTAFFALSLFWQRLRVMTWGGSAQRDSNEARDQQWAMGWPKILKWPFGNGIGESGETLQFRNSAGIITVDTYYLTALLEFGVVGFVVFFGMFATGAGTALFRGIRARGEATLLVPAGISLVAFIVIKGVLSQVGNHSLMFMLLGMIAALAFRASQDAGKTES